MKFRQYDQHQQMLLPPNITEMIPVNHLVRVIDTVVEQLDMQDLYNSYSEEGQPGYHPKMLLKILLYGYSTGIRSSRKLSQKLESDVFYMYLSAMQRPDFRTISDFRKDKRKYIQGYFIQVLVLCNALGMIKLGHISIDGSKIRASASKQKTKSYKELERLQKKLEDEIETILNDAVRLDEQEDRQYGIEKRGDEIPEELTNKQKLVEKLKEAKKYIEEQNLRRVNLTDPDSRFMKTSNGGIDNAYNTQVTVDSDSHLILCCDVVSEENDCKQFIPMYEQTVKNTGKKPLEVSADAGYYSGENYLYIEKNLVDAYVPDMMFRIETTESGEENIGKFDRRNFRYNQEEDNYQCPSGSELIYKESSRRNNVRFRIYQGTGCPNCELREQCISKPNARYRQIQIYENDKFKQEMRRKLLTEEGKHKYRKRLGTVEPVFAQIKHNLGFRQFLMRGIEKTKAEFNLICTAYNIKKLSKHLCTV